MSDKTRFDADSYLARRAANEARLETAGVYAPDMPTVKAAMMTVCVR